jgi:branched-chain amino acid transport system permease protein
MLTEFVFNMTGRGSGSKRLANPALLLLLLLACAALLTPLLGQPYYTKVVCRMLIFAIAALSLDLLVGYAGLISFGHAAFFGLGCYVAGVLPLFGIHHVALIVPAAMLIAGVFGCLVGAVSLRTSGLYFIFITLAFAQMIFYLAQGMRFLSGDDGFQLPAPTVILDQLTLANPTVLLYTSAVALGIAWVVCARVTTSRFGLIVRAARDNEKKLNAIGQSAYAPRLALFILASAIAAVAGVLYANLSQFVTPSSMSWIVSGELLFMVILGAAGSLTGAILGAIVFVGLEQILSGWTEHWHLALGLILLVRVLFLRDGLYGVLKK